MRRSITITAVLAAVALAAPTADAAPQWHIGTSETSTVLDCSFNQQPGIQVSAEARADPQILPKVGEVFYARVVAGRIGEGCGIYMGAHVEVVPPPGVSLAISTAHPVRCNWMDVSDGVLSPATGCPQGIYEGVHGAALDQLTPGGPTETYPWEIAYEAALVIEVPLVSSRPLHGTIPTCPRTSGMPPCAASSAGDTLQFTARMLDAWSSDWLSPYVPLFVEASPHESGAGGEDESGRGGENRGAAPTPLATAPSSLALRRLLRGLPVAVNVRRAGSRIRVQLRAKRLRRSRSAVIARKVIRRAKAGRLRLRLKPSRKAGRALRRARGKAIRVTLRVLVEPPRGRALTYMKRILVKR